MARMRYKHKPSISLQIRILEGQGCRCAYCNVGFDEAIIEWDHLIPVAYKRDNSELNMVAACKPCNQAKRARIFGSEADLRAFCIEMVKSHGSISSGTPKGISARFLAH